MGCSTHDIFFFPLSFLFFLFFFFPKKGALLWMLSHVFFD